MHFQSCKSKVYQFYGLVYNIDPFPSSHTLRMHRRETLSEERYFLSTTFLARLLHWLTYTSYASEDHQRSFTYFLLSSCLLHLSFCIRVCWSLVDSCKPHNRWTFRCIFWERVVRIKKWVMHTSVCIVCGYGQEMHISKWMWNRSKLIWCVLWGLHQERKCYMSLEGFNFISK